MDKTGREQLESLLERQNELERALAETRKALLDALAKQDRRFDRIDIRVSQIQARASQAHQAVRSVLNSRIWRTLVKAGDVLLRAHGAIRNLGRRSTSGSGSQFMVVCESPGVGESVSGSIDIAGWVVSARGISHVEVTAGETGAVKVRHGLWRPDLARRFPALPETGRCGFIAHLDTLLLQDGDCEILIRAFDKVGRSCETKVGIRIDHVHGYPNEYARWISEFEDRDPEIERLKIGTFQYPPLVSVLVPIYKTDPDILERTIRSVLAQSYPNWELCLADDHSQSDVIDRIVEEYAAKDLRIRFTRLPMNSGISAASNAALQMAGGEYVALLDHDDELSPDALFHVVDALQSEPRADILYSDEDHMDGEGMRSDPFFKPDWSPNLILSENYVCHLMVFRRELAKAAGGFRREADVSQDQDILLRMSLQAKRILHIPKILYHWRTERETAGRASEQQVKALASARQTLEEYLRLAQINATVEPGRVPGRWRVRYSIPGDPRVSIIVPTGGRLEVLQNNLDTLNRITDYSNYEIVIADNSNSRSVEEFVKAVKGKTIRYLDWRNRPFNYSAINNAAARTCDSPLLLFLNDDTCAIDSGWLTALVEQACRPEVGAAGARLLFPDGRIQHAGVVMGIFGLCGHAFKGVFGDERVYFDLPDVIRDVSALTAACLMTRAKVFWEVGGFDEVNFPIAYNDIDLTLKIREKGYQLVYTPHASLYHFEAFSKTPENLDPSPSETTALRKKWERLIERDPFYNPNLTVIAEDFSLRKKH